MTSNDVTSATNRAIDDLHRYFGSEVHNGNEQLVTEETPYFYNRTGGIYQPAEESPVWLEIEVNNPDSDYPLVTGEIRVQDRDAADIIDDSRDEYEAIVEQYSGRTIVPGVHAFRDSQHGYLLQLGFMQLKEGYDEEDMEQAAEAAGDVLENIHVAILDDLEAVYDAVRYGELETDEFDPDVKHRLGDKLRRYSRLNSN